MSCWNNSDKASIGYKIQKGDYICVTIPNVGTKCWRVTKVNGKQAMVNTGHRRHIMRFPRYYHIPFLPYQKNYAEQPYETKYPWHVRINDTWIKRKEAKVKV